MSRAGKLLISFEKLIKKNLTPSAKKIIGAIVLLLILGVVLLYLFVIRGVGVKYKLNEDGASYSVVGMGINFEEDIVIPEFYNELPVTAIGDTAFSNVLGKSIRSIEIPDSVTSIGWGAFINCKKLESITIPDGVTSIGEQTFAGCESLKSVDFGEGVEVIGSYVFTSCEALEEVKLPSVLKRIENGAFFYCVNLRSITLPYSLKYIGEEAFFECKSLESAVFENAEYWRAGTKSISYSELRDAADAADLLTDKYSEVEWKNSR